MMFLVYSYLCLCGDGVTVLGVGCLRLGFRPMPVSEDGPWGGGPLSEDAWEWGFRGLGF